ncbi:23S rRNA (adenine1618-N6)-methyltransferase [Saonia flava]|uniref:Ribosomal RNA large subunit methyltransferase F n=1 Tax=Saonia flava TaxID=523696 RepID=A0A846QWJ7_9FLAO|nr:23S rRNA (adenine(1618)-N(6))-methyltransferase RlmF [Saonia flava]NJB69955.1 23S rRNA (adenine1618-N6)-methyltransferase [Saonia flava]
MHPRNLHNKTYDFKKLINGHAPLQDFVFTNSYGTETIDFGNPKAVLALNKAILLSDYKLTDWELPEGYLCPPIPGRADYIHHIADVLKNEGMTEPVKGLDIGVGANCIYPLLGAQIYDWNMVGADIDQTAVVSARNNVGLNHELINKIEIRHQPNNADIFNGIIQPKEYFHFTLCNPPFHASKEEASKGSLQKLKNLKGSSALELNFGGQANELWCNGGEALFIKRMIKQSVAFAKQVGFFTCLVSKSDNLPKIKKQLNKLKASYSIIPMEQGNKKSRIVVWTFK